MGYSQIGKSSNIQIKSIRYIRIYSLISDYSFFKMLSAFCHNFDYKKRLGGLSRNKDNANMFLIIKRFGN